MSEKKSPLKEPTQEGPTLKTTAVKGAFWTLMSYGAGQVLRFGSNLILARLLFPELFGLMALLNVFLLGLSLFTDIGLGTSVVRSVRGEDPRFLNTIWTIQVARGGVLSLAFAAIAWPVAQFYGQPDILIYLPILGLNALIGGFSSTSLYIANRKLMVKTQVVFEIGIQVISLGVMLLWAWISPSIWALIAGSMVSNIARTVGSHFLIRDHKNTWDWDASSAKEVFSFGKWIFLSTSLTFLAGQSDRIILGKIFSLEMLGVYSIAFTFADMPRQIISALSGKVLFPVLSQMSQRPRPEFRQSLLNHRMKLLILLALGLGVLAASGDMVISLLYDDRYTQASWIFTILVIGIWPNMLSQTIDSALFAVGKPGYIAAGNLLRFLLILFGINLGYAIYGIPGAVIAIAFGELAYYTAIAFGTWREGLSGALQDIKATLLFIGTLGLFLWLRMLINLGSPFDALGKLWKL